MDISRYTAKTLRDEAKDFVSNFEAIGYTNINDALLKALERANNIRDGNGMTENFEKVEKMIIFLTDGYDTEGNADESIIANVEDNNQDAQIPIFALAFGKDADYKLLQDIVKRNNRISDTQNNGFVQRIYESGRAAEQLEEFYNITSQPKLKNLQFNYKDNGIDRATKSLTYLKSGKK